MYIEKITDGTLLKFAEIMNMDSYPNLVYEILWLFWNLTASSEEYSIKFKWTI